MKRISLLILGLFFAGGAYAENTLSGCELDGQIYPVGIMAPVNLRELTAMEERGEPVNDDNDGGLMMLCSYKVDPGGSTHFRTSRREYIWAAYEWGWD